MDKKLVLLGWIYKIFLIYDLTSKFFYIKIKLGLLVSKRIKKLGGNFGE